MTIAEKLRADNWKDLDSGKFKDQYDYLFYEKNGIRLEFTNHNLIIGYLDTINKPLDSLVFQNIPYENIKLIQKAINY